MTHLRESAFALAAFSHTPLMNRAGLAPEGDERDVHDRFAVLRRQIADFAPDLCIQFGNDHLSGFSLALMPAFCVGVHARSIGDFGYPSGPLKTDETIARRLVRSVQSRGVDVAFSYDMIVDHGFSQGLDLLFGGLDRQTVLPIAINSTCEIPVPYSRAIALGRTVGAFARENGLRTLFVATGGLSHDPPMLSLENASGENRVRLLEGWEWTEERLAARAEAIHRFGAATARGETHATPLDPSWDSSFLELVIARDFERIAALDDGEVRRFGGAGALEVRSWIAALAAIDAASASSFDLSLDYYRPIQAWATGFGIVSGQSRRAAAAA